jgi:predicted RNase H-like nuclease (RuvC/YqgF family)
MQAVLLEKAKRDRDDARGEADDVQRGAITMFNEQTCYESHIQRLQSVFYRAKNAVNKMRTEAVGLRSKINDLLEERSTVERQYEGADADNRTALEERDSTISDLRSLLEHRNQELDGLEQSVATTQG